MGKSQPFAPSFSASPRRNLYSFSSSRVDQEADQRRCSAPRICCATQALTSFLNSTTCCGSAETVKSMGYSSLLYSQLFFAFIGCVGGARSLHSHEDPKSLPWYSRVFLKSLLCVRPTTARGGKIAPACPRD